LGKRLAVLVRDRPTEALRVAVGLTLADNAVEVFVLGPLALDDPAAAEYLAVLRELRLRVATTSADNPGLEPLAVAALARQLLAFDHILPY
jgi:hypothetical protein